MGSLQEDIWIQVYFSSTQRMNTKLVETAYKENKKFENILKKKKESSKINKINMMNLSNYKFNGASPKALKWGLTFLLQLVWQVHGFPQSQGKMLTNICFGFRWIHKHSNKILSLYQGLNILKSKEIISFIVIRYSSVIIQWVQNLNPSHTTSLSRFIFKI